MGIAKDFGFLIFLILISMFVISVICYGAFIGGEPLQFAQDWEATSSSTLNDLGIFAFAFTIMLGIIAFGVKVFLDR